MLFVEGLSHLEAQERLRRYGLNALPEPPPEPLWRAFLRQMQSPLTYLLLLALALDLGVWLWEGGAGLPLEALAIAAILLLNALWGLVQEKRSEGALRRLKALAEAQVWVLRDGRFQRLPMSLLVPGDLVRLEAGDRVPADGVLLQAQGVWVDESLLSGESLPVEKGAGDEVYAGTLLVRGVALLRVERTGLKSAMGRIAGLLMATPEEPTPLERRVRVFARQVLGLVLGLALGLILLGALWEGLSTRLVLFAVALAVAAVPEGLPTVLTLTLALGVERMARRKALVRRLSAVEALGSVTLIATDKTGTLTENRMEVVRLIARDEDLALKALVLCNEADPQAGLGDPMELALLRYAEARGVGLEVRAQYPRLSGRPFDSAWRYMRVTTPLGSFLKGAPEALIPRMDLPQGEKERLLDQVGAWAQEGYRVLALAHGPGEAEEGLSLLGFVLLQDPPRPEVPEAVRRILKAGVRVVMITGDHPGTALALARQVGLPVRRVATGEELEGMTDEEVLEVDLFARVRPEQKLRIVALHQARGEVVAVTGDGVNDAPALKRADVGVAMGQRGSEVAREVADLVLLDDNFATIVAAIEEGRGIYENIKKFLRLLLAANLSEVSIVVLGFVLANLLGLRDELGQLLLPLSAVQILWINLVTDGLPALALGLDRNRGLLDQPPRPKDEPLLDPFSLRYILLAGGVLAGMALLLLGLLPLWGSLAWAQSAVFHFVVLGQLLLSYPARRGQTNPLPNPYLHLAVGLGLALQVLAGALLAPFLGLEALGWGWGLVLGAALLAWGLTEGLGRWAFPPGGAPIKPA